MPIQPEWKSIAIRRLGKVYREANKVLVIDRYLQQVSSDWLEQCLQLLASEWMQRLWTLQEGRLASELYIQFKDEAVSIQKLSDVDPDTHVHTDTYISDAIWWYVGKDIRSRFTKHQEGHQRFVDLMEDLSYRSVTVASDEPICIATLLGLSLEQFDAIPNMEDIYHSQSSIPQDILFVEGQRLTSPGYRWVPATFLQRGIVLGSVTAAISEEGLEVYKDCVIFKDDLRISEHSASSYGLNYVEVEQTGSDNLLFVRYRLEEATPSQSCKDAALIFKDISNFRSTAVLVSNLIKRNGILYCHFEDVFHVSRVNKFTSSIIRHFERLSFSPPSINQGEFRSGVTFCVD